MLQTDQKKIAIYLTNKCNLRCKHCFIEGSPLNEEFLSWSQIKTTLGYFAKKDYLAVELTGGESCLSPFFIRTIQLAKKLNYFVGVNTNGTNPQIIDVLKPGEIDKITFSLDGSKKATHDQLRGQGVFEHCLKNIKEAIARGFYCEAIFTVHRHNISEIPSTILLLDSLGIKKLSFNFISNQGTATFNQGLLITPEDWLKARKLIETTAPKTSHINLRYPLLFVSKEEFAEIKKNINYFCRLIDPVKTEIYPNGNIYHCCLVPSNNNGLTAGKVTPTKIIMNTAKEKAFVKKYQHSSCPAFLTRQLYPASSNLVPLCLYYKEFSRSI